MASNKVIAGDYSGYRVKAGWSGMAFLPPLFSQHGEPVVIDRYTVASYELVANESNRSVVSSVVRGLIGERLLGTVGMLSGITTARDKGVFTVSINFNDGRRSLIEVGNKQYKALIKSVF